MQAHDKRIIHSSMEANYRTPMDCFEALDREFHFDIDAAADSASTLCENFFGPDHPHAEYRNALTVEWNAYHIPTYSDRRPTIFLNPPFSKTLVNAYNTGRIKSNGGWVEHEQNPEKARVYDIENWAEKCWVESQKGATIVGVFPFAPQTAWYRQYVLGHEYEACEGDVFYGWSGHAAMQERRLPHRISFLQPDGTPTGNAGVNSVIVVWQPNSGIVGPWVPHSFYWSYRKEAA